MNGLEPDLLFANPRAEATVGHFVGRIPRWASPGFSIGSIFVTAFSGSNLGTVLTCQNLRFQTRSAHLFSNLTKIRQSSIKFAVVSVNLRLPALDTRSIAF